MAIFTYNMFTKAVVRIMETKSVSHDTFRAVTLQNDTFIGLLLLLKDFLRTRGTRAKFAMSWVILAGSFVLSIPTWLSAMAGYTADIQPFVNDANKNLKPAAGFQPVIYTIHDGDRLGPPYTRDYRVSIPWTAEYLSSGSNNYECTLPYLSSSSANAVLQWVNIQNTSNCVLLWRISEYVAKYGFLGRNDSSSVFFYPNDTKSDTGRSLDEPTLNISANFAVDPFYGGKCAVLSCSVLVCSPVKLYQLY